MKSKNDATSKKAKVQSTLNLPSTTKSTTCKLCGMTYFPHIQRDSQMHAKYHQTFVNGITWPQSLQDTEKVVQKSTIRHGQSSRQLALEFYLVDKNSPAQVRKVEEILKMVNKELNAPQDSGAWKEVCSSETSQEHSNGDEVSAVGNLIEGRAFVAVYDNKAIGLVTTDPIHSAEEQCKWMIFKTQTIVPKQINRAIRVGISRIWSAPKYRRLGIAKILLQCVSEHSIYGAKLEKNEIGFSQPSFSGGQLAKSFNGVTHKSGEILLPVYIER